MEGITVRLQEGHRSVNLPSVAGAILKPHTQGISPTNYTNLLAFYPEEWDMQPYRIA